ncbi:hypothetical protein BpHYR1_003756 [Brachionus plicatilis]|uniref:Uncharacterized protein n=1 Tax=Brachionus plicatilis TaxID=10195 RepID=A0A3M7P5W0_BRAPC|nr:hypothetical protein BpHYR1_003756 [Brachionus plicatilis]
MDFSPWLSSNFKSLNLIFLWLCVSLLKVIFNNYLELETLPNDWIQAIIKKPLWDNKNNNFRLGL